ncbi:MAG: NUDIX hydrolase [Gemmataceae bacterium]|nr:NUDIX hydrolase [Gemmataceae bacterium]
MAQQVRQAAAVPVADGRVCLVTSRGGRRWVVPKGLIDAGHTAGEAALVEAWEEAGLVGTLDPDPVGSYVYRKFDRDHLVLVYRMVVTEAKDAWPEAGVRQREWLTPAEAVDRIEEPGLQNLLRRLFDLPGPTPPAGG